jgi:hypothetical protein
MRRLSYLPDRNPSFADQEKPPLLSQLNTGGFNDDVRIMVGLGRFELPTSPLSGVRSNQLSYRPGDVRAALQLVERSLDTRPGLLLEIR